MYGQNVALLYGGGQIPSANLGIGLTAQILIERYKLKVYGVHKSFLGLTDSNCYEEFDLSKAKEIQKQIGTYLPTCREVDPADDKYFPKIISNLRKYDIHTLILLGGDGSSRAGKDLVQRAKEIWYELQIVFIPCTIDGIHGSDTIGIDSAVAESERQVSLMMVNAFATWNPKFLGPRIAIIEIQGRNRNDIAVKVIRNLTNRGKVGAYNISDINLIFIPAGYTWSFNELLEKVSTEKETAIIVSEGAKPTELYWNAIEGKTVGEKLENLIKQSKVREANLDKVGYLSQTNDQISEKEKEKIKYWVQFAVRKMDETNESIAVTRKKDFEIVLLNSFAEKTESKKAIPLTEKEMQEFKAYLL